MHSCATTAAATTTTTPFINPATSHHQHKYDDTPDRSATEQPVSTQDSFLDTFFNPVWTSGPHVFSYAEDGTVVRPEVYAPEPYPGYHAERARRLASASASHFQGFESKDPKPWKNVAITEQDDAEFEALRERARVGAVGEWGRYPPYAGFAPSPMPEGPELVYTWPPKPNGW